MIDIGYLIPKTTYIILTLNAQGSSIANCHHSTNHVQTGMLGINQGMPKFQIESPLFVGLVTTQNINGIFLYCNMLDSVVAFIYFVVCSSLRAKAVGTPEVKPKREQDSSMLRSKRAEREK